MSSTQKRVDCVVVGTGQAGKPLAKALAAAGHDTIVVERDRVGGTCVVDGCTPTKTMLASASAAHAARRAHELGVDVQGVSVDMERVRDRKRGVVDDFVSSGREGLEAQAGLELVQGHARFVDDRVLEVEREGGEHERIRAERIFLNVGGRPRVPALPGLDAVSFHDSTSIMEVDRVPEHLVVLGGGPVGLEFGQMFRRFGARVTVVEREEELLAREDDDVRAEMRRVLESDGITVLCGTEVARVADRSGGVSVVVRSGDEERSLDATELLVAVGRVPNSDDLDLDAAGVRTDERGFIVVDDRCRTNIDGIWALGDVTGAPPFTHIAYDDFRVVADDVLGEGRRTRERMLPYVIFTDPELGRVGITEAEATRRGIDYRVAKLPMRHVARAIETGRTEGFLKCLVDDADRILGVAAFAVQGGEIMSVLQMAMMGDIAYPAIRDGVLAHPTLAESLQNLFATLDG